MTQDPLIEKLTDIFIGAAELGWSKEGDRDQSLVFIGAAVEMLDAWAISRGLVKPPAVPDRAFDMARKMLGERLDRPGLGIWRSRDGSGWDGAAAKTFEDGIYLSATVTDGEVAAELAKEDAANGR